MQIKIIHILNHAPPMHHLGLKPEDALKYGPAEFIYLENEKKYIGFYLLDFHHSLAEFIKERTKEFELECWRPYGKYINKMYLKNVNGIIHKVFPSKEYRLPYLGDLMFSKLMLIELNKEIRSNNIILHIHDGHSRFITWLLWKIKDYNIPIVYQHRGYAFGKFVYKYSKKKYRIIPLLEYYFFQKPLTKKIISFYLAGAKYEKEFVMNELNIDNCDYFHDGILFNEIIPVVDKKKLRNELNLPLNKIIILYVGRFTDIKGIYKFYKIYKKVKKRKNNIQLIAIGGYKSDKYYDLLKNDGVIIHERMPRNELIKFYQAADIYVMPTIDPIVRNFGGFGSAPLEALACNVPVLSYNIINYPGTIEERNKIGRLIINEKETVENLEYMINNLHEFKEARKYTQKYYDNDIMIKKLLDIYNKLSDEYFNLNKNHLMF